MQAEKSFTVLLILMLATFAVLNAMGEQPGEDNNRWLLYLFLIAWPILSLATLVAGLRAVGRRRAAAVVAVAFSLASLGAFATWGHTYAGLW